jgi:UDP-GlcNAc:undecaprenyl-phosphate GlcNAc-1-phosphate transferase
LANLLEGRFDLALATVPLLGALLGFLPYNSNPASIFLGDCGSLTVGFLLGCYGVLWANKSATVPGMIAPLMALSVPLLDTLLAILRRFIRGQRIFAADRGHIHHRLLDRGLTPRRVVWLLYAFAGLAAGFSLLSSTNYRNSGGIAFLAFCAAVWAALDYLDYEEFAAARRILAGGMLREVIRTDLSIGQLEKTLSTSGDLEDCWQALLAACRVSGFSRAALQVGGRRLDALLTEAAPGNCWDVHIPLDGESYIRLSFPFESRRPAAAVSMLAQSLRCAFAENVSRFDRDRPAAFARDLGCLARAAGASVKRTIEVEVTQSHVNHNLSKLRLWPNASVPPPHNL